MKLKMIIEYDGSAFFGWQLQPDKLTVQGEIEAALFQITGNRIRITGAGRTDTGVHAIGQVADFEYFGNMKLTSLQKAINSISSPALYVKSIEPVSDSFDARRDAILKHYRYQIVIARSPYRSPRVWEYLYQLNVSRMDDAAIQLTGSHNYGEFCRIGDAKILTVDSIRLEKSGDEITIDVKGRGFLYKMVRRIVGVITDCGRGKIDIGDIPQLFSSANAFQTITAPAKGLVLVKVYYQKDCEED